MGAAGQTGYQVSEKRGTGGWKGVGQLEASRTPQGTLCWATFKRIEPSLAAATRFSGLFAMSWCHSGPHTTARSLAGVGSGNTYHSKHLARRVDQFGSTYSGANFWQKNNLGQARMYGKTPPPPPRCGAATASGCSTCQLHNCFLRANLISGLIPKIVFLLPDMYNTIPDSP